MITMHARHIEGLTGGQTDEHHGYNATIRSNERIAR